MIRTDVEHSAAVVRAVDEQSDVDTLATHLVFCNARDVVVKRRARAVGNDDVLCGDDDFTFDDLVVEFSENLFAALVHRKVVRDETVVVFGNVDSDLIFAYFRRSCRYSSVIHKIVYKRIFGLRIGEVHPVCRYRRL